MSRYFINIVANFPDDQDPTGYNWPQVLGPNGDVGVEKVEVSRDGRTKSSFLSPNADADECLRVTKDLAAELDTLPVGDKQAKNRKGIELHGKMERVAGQIKVLRSQGVDTTHVEPELRALSQRLLKDVFGIDESKGQA